MVEGGTRTVVNGCLVVCARSGVPTRAKGDQVDRVPYLTLVSAWRKNNLHDVSRNRAYDGTRDRRCDSPEFFRFAWSYHLAIVRKHELRCDVP